MVQRITVLLSDLVFLYACYRFMTKSLRTETDGRFSGSDKKKIWFYLNYFNVGLILLDNIHFQYNSMMYGIMLLSICFIFEVSIPSFVI